MAVAPGYRSHENLDRTGPYRQPGAMASAAMSTNEPAGNKTPAHDRVAQFRQTIIDTLDDREEFSAATILEDIALRVERREVSTDARNTSLGSLGDAEFTEVVHVGVNHVDGEYTSIVSAVGNAVLEAARRRHPEYSHPNFAGTPKRSLSIALPLEVLDE